MDWQRWMTSWDRQQEGYLPDREERFSTMLDVIDATCGSAPYVLDLACGLGSITDRVLERFPRARVVGLDIDPALLALNRAAHDRDPRVTVVEANLSTPAWLQALADETFDAVLTSTALHWLPAERVRRLYAEVSTVLRPKGVFCNADHMPSESSPLRKRIGDYIATRQRATFAQPTALDWASWWEALGAEPEFSALVARRNELFGGEGHPAEETPDAEWHLQSLRDGGFIDAAVVWRRYDDAVVAGLR
ncbi:MAG TPA: class I SAM-dependent methyltransferase [Actinomycetes bacterium]|nr:class I SAM-dependent methyltransferase [Actinomycetes bacterium]